MGVAFEPSVMASKTLLFKQHCESQLHRGIAGLVEDLLGVKSRESSKFGGRLRICNWRMSDRHPKVIFLGIGWRAARIVDQWDIY